VAAGSGAVRSTDGFANSDSPIGTGAEYDWPPFVERIADSLFSS
jgi:hypothetical protein